MEGVINTAIEQGGADERIGEDPVNVAWWHRRWSVHRAGRHGPFGALAGDRGDAVGVRAVAQNRQALRLCGGRVADLQVADRGVGQLATLASP